jgi:sorting nexin-1/2
VCIVRDNHSFLQPNVAGQVQVSQKRILTLVTNLFNQSTALEKFLRRVVIHPELFDASCLQTFLKADDMTFQHAKNVSQQMDSPSNNNMDMSNSLGGAGAFNLAPKNTSGIKKWFSEAKTTISNDLVTSPDDDLFDEIERYIEALAIQMRRVSTQASGMVRKSKELAHGYFEFGLAFHQLSQSEGEALGRKLELMGGTADTLSAMASSHADQEWRKLDEPFKDYLKTIQGVKVALSRRHDKRVSYSALLHEIQTREGNLHRLRMTPGSEAKAYSTEMSLQRYQAAAEAAREEYAECSQRVLREVDRFKREKAEEMKLVVLDFITLQIKVNREMEQIWGELVPQLEEGSVGEIPIHVGSQSPQQPVQPQPTIVNMPPSQAPPPVPPMPSQPTYSNVPATGSESLMESSIQYRDNNLPGMGL